MPLGRWLVQGDDGPLEPSTEELCNTICTRFQIEKVHVWQALVMQAILQGQDVVVSSGTGSGKSLVFQGLTLSRKNAVVLVISPLISIMEDQVWPYVITTC